MKIMPFNPDLNKQDQEVTFSMTIIKSYHSQICLNNILEIYPNKKLNFPYHILVKNVQINARNSCH